MFDVPAQLLRTAPADPVIKVTLTDDTSVTAEGRVREVAAQADPVTRTFQVRVGLDDPPVAMRLGSTVIGQVRLENEPAIEIPASALVAFNGRPAVWIVDPVAMTVSLRNIEVQRFDPATVVVASGLDTGEVVVTAGVQALHPGQKVRLLGSGHDALQPVGMGDQEKSLVIYLMIICVAAGLFSYLRLGRSEDPSFIIKTMVVQAAWPGASVQDTLQQVTERIERTLQETPKLDFLRSYTRPGLTTIFVNLEGSATAAEVPDLWYHVRKSVGDMRATLSGRSGWAGLQ